MASPKRSVKIVINTALIDREFFSQSGSVAQLTKRAANEVLIEAGDFVGTEYSGSYDNNRGRSKHLGDSGKVVSAGGPDYTVVFTHPAAVVHHKGARRHQIKARKIDAKGRPSMFRHVGGGGAGTPWEGARREVTHPGHKGNPYLVKAARAVGLKVSTHPGGFAQRGFARIPRSFT